MGRVFRALFRLMARTCPFRRVRHRLIKLSGVSLGSEAFINMHVLFIDNYRGGAISIGERVAVAPGVTFIADSDPNNSKLAQIKRYIITGSIRVDDDAWLGANSVVLPNVSIGRCAIVAAGAVVTKNVNDFEIVAGIPARVIGSNATKIGC
jgi:acetyltransferase-like isoleucine patch superfamily enzyme